jgi:phage terminase small subunit
MRTANETKEGLYVAAILKGASRKAAAMEAGFSESTAGHSATRLYKKESVQKALESARQELKTQTSYGIQECIREIDETIG